MNVSKVITLPAPVQRHPELQRLGLLQLSVMPFQKQATVTLVAVTADGVAVDGGDVISQGVSGTDYDTVVEPLANILMEAIRSALIARGVIDQASTLEDATP